MIVSMHLRQNIVCLIAVVMLVTFAAVSAYAASSQTTGFQIVENGKPRAAIVIGKQAAETERHAALELTAYVKKMTGAKLQITSTESLPKDRNLGLILIGRPGTNPLVRRLAESKSVELSYNKPGLDGYIIKTVSSKDQPPTLVLGGSRDRGTLYAVYDLLARFAHVGFFWDAERIPRMKSFAVPSVSISERPFFRDRLILQPIVSNN
ncbi:MAG: hypothetical protein HYX78_09840 [Armatimonadetes bacterium]|nr:hypothetical protein [Armatimonadota bacterium]